MVLMNNKDTELYSNTNQYIDACTVTIMFISYQTCTTGNTCKIYKKFILASTQIFFVSIFFKKRSLHFSLIFIDFLVVFFFQKNTENRIQWHLTGVVIEYPFMMRYISDWIFTDISFGVNLKVTLKVKKKKIRLATVRCMIKTCCFQCPLTQSVIRNWQDQCDFN